MTNVPDHSDYGRQFAGIYDDLFPRENVTPGQIDWLAALAGGLSHPHVVEFGVGTGRIALPLYDALRQHGPVDYVGVDVSEEMLEALRKKNPDNSITTLTADMVEGAPVACADVVLCICGTISMVADAEAQRQTLRNAAEVLRPGGTLVVEIHNPDLVQRMHGNQRRITLAVPYHGGDHVLVTFAELEPPVWRVDHCWVARDAATFASETSRLTTLTELDTYASAAGFSVMGHYDGLTGAPIHENSAMITGVYRLDNEASNLRG